MGPSHPITEVPGQDTGGQDWARPCALCDQPTIWPESLMGHTHRVSSDRMEEEPRFQKKVDPLFILNSSAWPPLLMSNLNCVQYRRSNGCAPTDKDRYLQTAPSFCCLLEHKVVFIP